MAALSGTVKDSSGANAARLVRVYRKDIGEMVGWTISDAATGAWSIPTANTDEHFAVMHDVVGAPEFSKTQLMLRMQDSGLTDDLGHAVTINGAVRSSAQYTFGSYSAYFDGSNDYLSIAHASDLNKTTGDFEISVVFYCTSLSGESRVLLDKDGVSGTSYPQFNLSVTSSGKLSAFLGNGNGVSPTGTRITSDTSVTLNAWQQAKIVVLGSIYAIFLNGVLEGITTKPAMYDGGKALLIGYAAGQPAGAYFAGYINRVTITSFARAVRNTCLLETAAIGSSYSSAGENALIYDAVIPV